MFSGTRNLSRQVVQHQWTQVPPRVGIIGDEREAASPRRRAAPGERRDTSTPSHVYLPGWVAPSWKAVVVRMNGMCPWNITSHPPAKANPGHELLPGLTGRAKWAVDHFGRANGRWKVGRGARPRWRRGGSLSENRQGGRRLGQPAYLETVRHPCIFSERPLSDSTRPRAARTIRRRPLLLTLALAGVLALQAHRTFLDHRATAERVLQTTRASRPPGSGSESGWSCITRRLAHGRRPVSRQSRNARRTVAHPGEARQ